MKNTMLASLWLGLFCVVVGIVLAVIGTKPGILPAVMVAVGGGMVGGWALMLIHQKGGRDEMVVRVEALSGNYAFLATLWLVIALGIVNGLYSLPWSLAELLLVMMLFMSITNLLFRWILLKRGKVE
ncbi:MAG: hypothetical protein GXX84_12960 [Acidobacteria bacterium]|nr:hypothetical protein [Acidobacteriota bacterium]